MHRINGVKNQIEKNLLDLLGVNFQGSFFVQFLDEADMMSSKFVLIEIFSSND